MTANIKRRDAFEVVWEKIDKRLVQPGDYHWCSALAPELATKATPPHVCLIWRKSEDQDWQPEVPNQNALNNPIDQLIQRVQFTGGDLEGNNVGVLAMLYQAKALERIADTLDFIEAALNVVKQP